MNHFRVKCRCWFIEQNDFGLHGQGAGNRCALLLALRFIQAIGVCAAAVTWQALVIDRYPSDKANRVFAGIMPLMGLSPALAPLLGAVVLNHLGWQAIFAVLLGSALLLIVPTLLLKEKARSVVSTPQATQVSYWKLLCSESFSGNVIDFFAHFSAINMDGYKTLKAGQPVSFEIIQGPKGLHAVAITDAKAIAPQTVTETEGQPLAV